MILIAIKFLKQSIRLLNSGIFNQNLKEFEIINKFGSPEEYFERIL